MSQWPFKPPFLLTVPPQLQAMQKQFEEFYARKFAKRQVIWQFDKGSVLL